MGDKSRPDTASTVATHTTRTHSASANSHAPSGEEGSQHPKEPPAIKHDLFSRRGLIYTGPDDLTSGKRRVVTVGDYGGQFIGEGRRSQESTANLSYMFNAPKGARFPLAKNGRIGETGWEVTNLHPFD